MKVYETLHEAYLGTLADVYDNPEFIASPRGQKTREITDYTFRVLSPKVEYIKTHDEERNKVIESYSKKEFEIYDKGTNLVEDFKQISKFWGKLANPDGKTVNSAYGYLIFKNQSHGNPFMENLLYEEKKNDLETAYRNQIIEYPELIRRRNELKNNPRTPWEWAKHSLKSDKNTRQAILRFSLPEHQFVGNLDQTCTMHGNFLIRENKLNLSITMRSNDLMLGLVYDLPWFISLMYRMKDELKDVYPELEIGYYTHTVHSMHIYDRNEEAILKMLGRV